MATIKSDKNIPGDPIKIGFIGGGNMAHAIVKGILNSKLFEPQDLMVSGRHESSFGRWKSLNVKTTLNNMDIINNCHVVFLCVKPACLDEVARSILSGFSHEVDPEYTTKSFVSTLVSILAGTSLDKIKKSIPIFESYVRAMPNTPLQVLAGCTAITKSIWGARSNLKHKNAIESNFKVVETVFKSLGIVEIVEESKFDAVTGVSGSGPAYVYIIIEALSDAGVKQGLPRDIATKFAAQTLLGASKTVLESGFHPGVLKDQVTSSGGTTIHAIHELEKGGIRNTLINAVEAATLRSKEMSNN